MMIGWATPTVEPLAGTNLGGPNGAVPVDGVGSCPPAGPATTATGSGGGAGRGDLHRSAVGRHGGAVVAGGTDNSGERDAVDALGITLRTVNFHVQQIYRKLPASRGGFP